MCNVKWRYFVMSGNNVTAAPGQERQNRKLLEQLEEQKKRLRAQNAGTTAGGSSLPQSSGSTSQPTLPESSSQNMTPAQRAALQHAHANSVGFFITQDSAFGNLILPVLPRFDTK